MLRLFFMIAWLGFVAACGDIVDRARGAPETAPETPAATPERAPPETAAEPEPYVPQPRPSARARASQIDWDSARNDLASRPGTVAPARFGIESGATAPPVPVLLPTGIVIPQGVGEPAFRALRDGYFANYPGIDYDITISGTNIVHDGASGRTEGSENVTFAATASGAQVSLSRYGADYLVEFECRQLAGISGDACISEDAAMQIARDLVIVGSR